MNTTPRVISNSGGRTSGLLTWLEMQNGLGPNDYVIFCNTGKEREETLLFLHQQETVLGVPLIWLEYCRFNKWKRVSYKTAARAGEPFIEMLLYRRPHSPLFLPHARARFCTSDLKILVIEAFMKSHGHGLKTLQGDYEQYENLVGIRYDEPRRWKLKDEENKHSVNVLPLLEAKITKPNVLTFWKQQPFDLQLSPHESNCDLCPLKGKPVILRTLQEEPERGDWWDELEEVAGGTFRKGTRMKDLQHMARTQTLIPLEVVQQEPAVSCFCGD